MTELSEGEKEELREKYTQRVTLSTGMVTHIVRLEALVAAVEAERLKHENAYDHGHSDGVVAERERAANKCETVGKYLLEFGKGYDTETIVQTANSIRAAIEAGEGEP